MKNLIFINSLNWWVLLEPNLKNSSKYRYEVFQTSRSCFPILKGLIIKGEKISVQQKSVGISQQQIQLLGEELKNIID